MEEKGQRPRLKDQPEILIGLGSKSKRSPKRNLEKSLDNKTPLVNNDTKKSKDSDVPAKMGDVSPPPIKEQRPGEADQPAIPAKEASQSGEAEFMLSKELHHRPRSNSALLPVLSNGKKLNPDLLPKPSFYRADIYRERKLRRARAMAALRRKAAG